MTLGSILSEPQNFSLPLVVIWWEEAGWGLSPGPHTKSLALNFILESMRCTIDLHFFVYTHEIISHGFQ